MNILTVLSCGIEGCGITKNSIEFTDYINTFIKEHNAVCIANSDIKRANGRSSNETYDKIHSLSFTKESDKVKQYFSESDVIIFMDLPRSKEPDEIKENFIELLDYAKRLNKFVCHCQFNHKIHALRKFLYGDLKYINVLEKFDVIFNHSYENDFVKRIVEPNNLKIKHLVCRGDYNIENLFGIDFLSLRNKFWKPVSEKEYKTIKFIGRSAAWKGPWKFRDFHYDYLKNDGWISSAEGIELSLGSLNQIYSELKPKKVVRNDVDLTYFSSSKSNLAKLNTNDFTLERNKSIYFMPAYIRENGMERLSKCQFGLELLKLDDKYCKDVIENAMFEMVAVGCIPIFRKQWAEKFIVDGKPLIEYESQCGTIFLDEDNLSSSLELLNTLANDQQLYDEWREKAFSFYSKYYDVRQIYKKLIEVIETIKNC